MLESIADDALLKWGIGGGVMLLVTVPMMRWLLNSLDAKLTVLDTNLKALSVSTSEIKSSIASLKNLKRRERQKNAVQAAHMRSHILRIEKALKIENQPDLLPPEDLDELEEDEDEDEGKR